MIQYPAMLEPHGLHIDATADGKGLINLLEMLGTFGICMIDL